MIWFVLSGLLMAGWLAAILVVVAVCRASSVGDCADRTRRTLSDDGFLPASIRGRAPKSSCAGRPHERAPAHGASHRRTKL